MKTAKLILDSIKEPDAFTELCWDLGLIRKNESDPDGDPIESPLLIQQKKYLPNPTQRFCTAFMKLWTTVSFLHDLGYGYETTHVIGLRGDEPDRVSKRRARDSSSPWDVSFPLYDANVSRADVLSFWKSQPFDLRIPVGAGNCRLCFEKGTAQLRNLITVCPSSADRMIRRVAAPPIVVARDCRRCRG